VPGTSKIEFYTCYCFLSNTLILHIQTVKPRVSLIQVAEPSVQKLFCTIKWVAQNDHQNAPTTGSATYNAKLG